MAPSPGFSPSVPFGSSAGPAVHGRRSERTHHLLRSKPPSLCELHSVLVALCRVCLKFHIFLFVVPLLPATFGMPPQVTPAQRTIFGFSFSSSSFSPSCCGLNFPKLASAGHHPVTDWNADAHRVAYLPSLSYFLPFPPKLPGSSEPSNRDSMLSRRTPFPPALAVHSSMPSRAHVSSCASYDFCSLSSSGLYSSSHDSSLSPGVSGASMPEERVQLGSPKYRKGAVRSRRYKTPKIPYEPKDPVFFAPPLPPPDVPLPPGVSSSPRLRGRDSQLKTDGLQKGGQDPAVFGAEGCGRRAGSCLSPGGREVSKAAERRMKSESQTEEEGDLDQRTPRPETVENSLSSLARELFDLDAVGDRYTLRVPPIDARARRTLWIHRHLSRRSGTLSPVQEGVTDLLLSHEVPNDVFLDLSLDESAQQVDSSLSSSSGSSPSSSPYLQLLRSLAFPGLLDFSAAELKCLLSRYPSILLPRRAAGCTDAVNWLTRERNWSPQAVRSLLLHVPAALAQGFPRVTVWLKEFEELFDGESEKTASQFSGSKEEARDAQEEGGSGEAPRGDVAEKLNSQVTAEPTQDAKLTHDSQHARDVRQDLAYPGAPKQQQGDGGTLSRLEKIAIASPMVFNVRRPKAKITHFVKVWRQVRATRSEFRPAEWRAPVQNSFLKTDAPGPESDELSVGARRGQNQVLLTERTSVGGAAPAGKVHSEAQGEQQPSSVDSESLELEWYRGHYERLEAFTGENLPSADQSGHAALQADADRLRRAMAREEIALRDLFLRYPKLFTMRVEGNVRSKLLYLQNNMLKELEEVLEFPQFLSYSLRRRIIPRHIALVNVFLKREREKRKATSVLFDEGKLVAATRKAGRVRRQWDARMQLKRKLKAQVLYRRKQLNPSGCLYDREFWEQKELLQEEQLPIVDDRKGWRGVEPYQPLSMPALPALREMFATSDERFRQLFGIPYQDFVGAKLDAEKVKNPQTLF